TVSGITSAISQVTVTLHVTHAVANQLGLSLVGPDGTTVLLHRPGSIFDDFGSNFGTDCPAGSNDTTFDDAAAAPVSAGRLPLVGSFRPQEPLAAFSGLSGSAVNGTWRLRAQDNGPLGGGGSIECAVISFGSAGPGPGGCGGPVIDLSVDFNRDARTDILLRQPSTSHVAVSYMDGLTLTGIAATSPPVLANSDWFIQGTGDFNGDGLPDLLWRNLPTGLIAVTFMNGVVVTSATLTSPPVVT